MPAVFKEHNNNYNHYQKSHHKVTLDFMGPVTETQ